MATDPQAVDPLIAIIAITGAVSMVILIRLLLRTLRMLRRIEIEPADLLTAVAAGAASILAGEGMWRVSRDILHLPLVVLLLTFAFLEIAVGASALRARRNIVQHGKAGADGLAVWIFTAISALLSAIDSRSASEIIARGAIPFVAAWLWERGLAEARRSHRQPLAWCLTLEHLLAALRITDTNPESTPQLTRLAMAIARHQRAGRIARPFSRHRLAAALRRTAAHTDLASNVTARSQVLQCVGLLTSADTLASIAVPSPWEASAAQGSGNTPCISAIHQVEAELARNLVLQPAWHPDVQTLAAAQHQTSEWAQFRIRSAQAIAAFMIRIQEQPEQVPDLAEIAGSFGKDTLWARARFDTARRLLAETESLLDVQAA